MYQQISYMSTRKQQKEYINANVCDLSDDERLVILQMLMNSIPNNKIHTKGSGTQIKFSNIPNDILVLIYNYIKEKIDSRKDELNSFPE